MSLTAKIKPDLFDALCLAHGIPKPDHEFRFNPKRRWRFDYAWVDYGLALECEGGVWMGGRHNRGKGFMADLEKYNWAVLDGWRILRCVPADIKSGAACALVKRALAGN
jgi:hypothetical protein